MDATQAAMDDGLLHATAATCDLGYAWVGTTLRSGLAEATPQDVAELAAAMPGGLEAVSATKAFKDQSDKLEFLVAASVIVHEETHFYQLISTPYGRLQSEIERYWTSDVVHIARDLASTGAIDRNSIPLRAWVDEHLERDSSKRSLALFAELAYTQTIAFSSCLAGSRFVGFLGHEVRDLTIGDAVNAWTGFLLAQDRAEGVWEGLDIQQSTHPSTLGTALGEFAPAVPVVDGTPITPRAIYEGAAQEMQLDYARAAFRDPADRPTVLRLLNSGLLDSAYVTTRRLVAERLAGLSWPERRCVLLTLSDLALWGPTHRDYVGGDDSEVLWEDLHPGYRFLRALNVVVEARRQRRVADLNDAMAVTHLVCSALGWLPPTAMARNYLEASSADPAVGAAQDALHQRRLRAAEARLAEPAVFIDGTNEHEIHQRFDLVMPFVLERGRVRMRESPEAWGTILLPVIAHVARRMFEGSPTYLFDEPATARDDVHSGALEALFGERADEFAPLLDSSDAKPLTADLSARFASEAASIPELERWMEANDLHRHVLAVRAARLSRRDEAVDWYLRQPAVVEAMLKTVELRPDGGATAHWPAGLGVLANAVKSCDPTTLTELFEDCGVHWLSRDVFGRTLEQLQQVYPPDAPR